MTGDRSLLHDIIPSDTYNIVLPIGSITHAHHICIVKIMSLTLRNVLFVLGLSCHLISFGSLTADLQCVVTLSDKVCVIQDRTSRTLI